MAVLDLQSRKDQMKGLKDGDKLYTSKVSKKPDGSYETSIDTIVFHKYAEAPVAPSEPKEKTADAMDAYARQLRNFERYKKAYEEGLFAVVTIIDPTDTKEKPEQQSIIDLSRGLNTTTEGTLKDLRGDLEKMIASIDSYKEPVPTEADKAEESAPKAESK